MIFKGPHNFKVMALGSNLECHHIPHMLWDLEHLISFVIKWHVNTNLNNRVSSVCKKILTINKPGGLPATSPGFSGQLPSKIHCAIFCIFFSPSRGVKIVSIASALFICLCITKEHEIPQNEEPEASTSILQCRQRCSKMNTNVDQC